MEDTLFNIDTGPQETCRHCKHRIRVEQNFSYKVYQCCRKRPTTRNFAGYAYIKVTNPACGMFEK